MIKMATGFMSMIYRLAVVACFAVFASCSSNKYQQAAAVIPQVDTSKPLVVVFYRPLECVGCNGILVGLLANSDLRARVGDNAYIVFNGVRDIELKDYEANLLEIGNIDLRLLNSEDAYQTLLNLTGLKTMNPLNHMAIIYPTGVVDTFYLKNPGLIVKANKSLNSNE